MLYQYQVLDVILTLLCILALVKGRKVKGERERYIQRNVEFQRIARTDKKVLISEQCKEVEENNRMGKTRDFKKIRYQGNISCKDGYNKGQKL